MPIGIKINIDLVVTIVEVKIYIYDPFLLHLDWTQWGNIELYPLLPQNWWGTDGLG